MALAAVAFCMSQAGGAQDNSATEDRNDVPGPNLTNPASSDGILSSVIDLPFQQYVDVTLLRDAYSNGDASTITDIGLQLQEGERILQRPHRAFEAREILEVALSVAAARQDVGTIERLKKIAETSGNTALAEGISMASQLAAQQRAAIPEIPEESDNLPSEEIAALRNLLEQLEIARAVGNRNTLLALQSRLEQSPLERGEFRSYLESQLKDAIAQPTVSPDESSTALSVLETLSGETRAITLAPLGMSVRNPNTNKDRTAYFDGAQPAYEVAAGTVTYYDFRTNQVRTAAKNTIDGLRALYGSIYVNYGTFMEIQIDAQGNALMQNGQTVRAFPRRALTVVPGKENEIQVQQRRPEGGWFTQPYTITMNEALKWALEMPNGEAGPMKRGNTPLISVTGAAILPERVIAKKAGSFNMAEFKAVGFGYTELRMVEQAGGGQLTLRTTGLIGKVKEIFTKAGPAGSATISQIVAVGGDKITVYDIVAAGGGNIVAAGGGNIVAAGGGNIVAAGGGNLQWTFWKISEAASQTISEDILARKMDWLIGKGGAGLGALLGNDASRLSLVSQQIDAGLELKTNSLNIKEVIVNAAIAGKLGAGYSLKSGTANPDFVNAQRLKK